MANVEVAEIAAFRVDPEAPPARINVGAIAMFRVAPAGPAAKVEVSDVWITRGFEPPVVPEGGTRVRNGSTWDSYSVRIKVNGVWV